MRVGMYICICICICIYIYIYKYVYTYGRACDFCVDAIICTKYISVGSLMLIARERSVFAFCFSHISHFDNIIRCNVQFHECDCSRFSFVCVMAVFSFSYIY